MADDKHARTTSSHRTRPHFTFPPTLIETTEPPVQDKLKESVTVVLNPPPPTTDKKKVPESYPSFREDQSELEQHNLQSFKDLIFFQGADSSGYAGQASIWGVTLWTGDKRDVVLLKFLRACACNVNQSFMLLRNTMKWRREFGVDALLEEDLGNDLEKVVFMNGHDKEGHPVCYTVNGEFQNKDLYEKTFGDEEKRLRFFRWRIQFFERSIRKLDFSPGGVSSLLEVRDLKNSPILRKRELRIANKKVLKVLLDNYPECVTKLVFINAPWWRLTFFNVISFFLPRIRSKVDFASPAKTAETLFKYIAPEQVPTQYGGLSVDFCECNPEFVVDDPATEIIVKPATKLTVEIIIMEKCTLVWELRVVGWEVSYSAEFVPSDEHASTVIIQQGRKMVPSNEPVISSSFNVTDLGKILLTIDNPTAKKKKLLYRYKVVPLPD